MHVPNRHTFPRTVEFCDIRLRGGTVFRYFEAELQERHGRVDVRKGTTLAAPATPPMKPPSSDEFFFLFFSLFLVIGCVTSRTHIEPEIPTTEPSRLCTETRTTGCRTVQDVERLLRSPDLRILDATGTPNGNQGAYLLTLEGQGVAFRAKWREQRAPASVVARFSDAEREVITYRTQKFLFTPEEYVEPPTSGYCFPTSHYRKMVDQGAKRSLETANCIFGFLSYWLPEVQTFKALEEERGSYNGGDLYSEERFQNHGHYAREIARLNVFTFVVDHDDAHQAQFPLIAEPFQVWSVDHSMSLSAIENPLLWFTKDWKQMRVPAIPSDLALRVSSIEEHDVESLAHIESYEKKGDRLVPIRNSSQGEGIEGWGASKRERQIVWRKIHRLQEMLMSGELGIFEVGDD